MKILYDHQIFSSQKFGGISKYFYELIRNIPTENHYNLSLLFSENHYLNNDINFKKTNLLPDTNFNGRGKLQNLLYHINQAYSSRSIRKNNFDIFHPTFFDPYFLKKLKKPYVITVHDLMAFKYKDSFFANYRMRPEIEKVIKNANRIISISKNTKKDIIEIFNINPEKIDIIYHGYTKPARQNESNRYGRYILFVGGRDQYKNFKIFLKAVSILLCKERDLKLICVGGPFNKEEIDDLRTLKIIGQVISLHVDEKVLNNLYSHALVFVYPSQYEGFGMPILEAFANDCPVCLSNVSSLPEIAGNAGVYFDPHDVDSIYDAIKKTIYDETFSAKIIAAGKIRLNNFSWRKCAEQTIDSYRLAI